jgi:phenylpropionate dioxygenase-like ring-hydroxylating dioxygenase large terminal subunit
MKAAAVAVAKENGTPRHDEVRSIIEQRTQSGYMENGLFLRNLWYFALHGDKLKKGKLQTKELLGERIVFGRDSTGNPFALRDNCPHRGMPLSEGKFDGRTIQCCYHGWQFDSSGTCQKIPALADTSLNVSNIKAYSYPCKEVSGTIWVYMSNDKHQPQVPDNAFPDLLISSDKRLRHVDTVELPTNIDDAIIGLVDPAHVTFVHQSWFWRSAKSLKRKHFEPVGLGFRMVRHKPSANAKGYAILNGETSTEISFQLPGHRFEHILVGQNDVIVSTTLLTPINETTTELNHVFYSSLNFIKHFWWPFKRLGKTFIGQDRDTFKKLSRGLQNDPKQMLLGDPDAQARWYFELKKQWQPALQNENQFLNPLKPQTLQWIT